MAKRRPVRTAAGVSGDGPAADLGRPFASDQRSITPASLLGMAAALVAAAVVYAGYWPSDSIAVQTGGARYLVGLLLAAAALAMFVRAPQERGDWLIDALAWGLALWMVIATWANAEGANLRLAVNELWWWIAAAALLSAARRCVVLPPVKLALVNLILGVTVGVAIYGWYQLLVDFPRLIAEYKADPEAVLRKAGIVAEAGSAQRVMFENRLYDGGPTGTFALANSMAALLVGGLVVMIGHLGQRWRQLSVFSRIGWASAMLVTLGMLIASRSRSAVAALLLITAAFLCLRLVSSGQRELDRRPRRGVLIGGLLAMVLALGLASVVVGQRWSHSEWVSQAPASVAIRINYWRASAKMVAQSPLVGVGPGQFKARYEAFRAPESTEQIADPHNWFWQALTTGGIPAGLLLLALVLTIVWQSISRPGLSDLATEPPDGAPVASASQWAFSARWIYIGAGAAALAVWFVGAAVGYLPDFDAAMLATLAAIGVIVLAARSAGPAAEAVGDSRSRSRIALWGFAAIVIDLLAAGGLTVPGVAVTLWVFAAVAAPWAGTFSLAADDGPTGSSRSGRWLIGGVAAVLLASWYVTAIRPVQQVAGAMGQFQVAWAQRSSGAAEAALRRAMQADPWDAEPALHLAQLLMQQALVDPSQRSRFEASWQQAEDEALHRSGNDPASLRVLADARLWYYQRYGDQAVLRRAAELYGRSVELSPSHQSYAAQLAEVYRELDDPRAAKLADTAQRLAQTGGYHERTLPYIIVLVAKPLAEAALAGPVQRPASEVLAPLLPGPN